jgi:hypothetical protein
MPRNVGYAAKTTNPIVAGTMRSIATCQSRRCAGLLVFIRRLILALPIVLAAAPTIVMLSLG